MDWKDQVDKKLAELAQRIDQIDPPVPSVPQHVFTKDLIGGVCQRCGMSSAEAARGQPCLDYWSSVGGDQSSLFDELVSVRAERDQLQATIKHMNETDRMLWVVLDKLALALDPKSNGDGDTLRVLEEGPEIVAQLRRTIAVLSD